MTGQWALTTLQTVYRHLTKDVPIHLLSCDRTVSATAQVLLQCKKITTFRYSEPCMAFKKKASRPISSLLYYLNV